MLFAVPAVLLAVLAMVGIAYLLAAVVLLIREANFFVDTMQFVVGMMSGTAFPVTLLPGVLQPIALALTRTGAALVFILLAVIVGLVSSRLPEGSGGRRGHRRDRAGGGGRRGSSRG